MYAIRSYYGTIKIHPDKIREVIGPGGKIIRGIQSETNTSIEIDDSGLVKIAAYSKEEGDAALKMVQDLTREPEVTALSCGARSREELEERMDQIGAEHTIRRVR